MCCFHHIARIARQIFRLQSQHFLSDSCPIADHHAPISDLFLNRTNVHNMTQPAVLFQHHFSRFHQVHRGLLLEFSLLLFFELIHWHAHLRRVLFLLLSNNVIVSTDLLFAQHSRNEIVCGVIHLCAFVTDSVNVMCVCERHTLRCVCVNDNIVCVCHCHTLSPHFVVLYLVCWGCVCVWRASRVAPAHREQASSLLPGDSPPLGDWQDTHIVTKHHLRPRLQLLLVCAVPQQIKPRLGHVGGVQNCHLHPRVCVLVEQLNAQITILQHACWV